MEYLEVNGGKVLKGEVEISGSKNAAFPVLSACLLIEGKCHINNIPNILDVKKFLFQLKKIGVNVLEGDHEVEIDATSSYKPEIPPEETENIRGTQTLLGAFIAKHRKASIAGLGGCNIGKRPIDQHIKGLESLGVEFNWDKGILKANSPKGLKGNKIFLDMPSVGATENIILASVFAEGDTIIENAAREPEIRDLINFLKLAGANIEVNGTGSTIIVHGVKKLRPIEYSIIPDRIESATYLILSGLTKGKIKVKKTIPEHLEAVIMKLKEIGLDISVKENEIVAKYTGKMSPTTVKTLPYPGFPTDAQSQILTLLTLADGASVVTETVFENRFRIVDDLIKMGANIKVEGISAFITGVKELKPSVVVAKDLRGGMSLLLATLSAKGISKVLDPIHIDRGYENYIEKIQRLGGDVERKNS
ncbi:UDP-N-acetylglucosamine 1-carboxyvinyltransferase [Caldisericum exile]|uniref:UDP-N-acetylglucosamine 1-carboxyvinyltransferase n=1 Tax=Caldisericum exile (strain DSM 21853 / NBRC 104410 / AZM16c01) TaxID=511051 RepID=A0A7U6GEG4_CALEA|nr:UDP-N-acetylglucosamine 1-carboxyvinyltransferase [Caldisericum exile]BAL80875.1 UDP-N-acetylglucosamine 1-carboxyvinyltransferase [Caldisericum exile AZM16c01]